MRRGRVFKRCGNCGARVPRLECARCRATTGSWTFVVDTALPGFPRHQRSRGGFTTKTLARAAMTRFLSEPEGAMAADRAELTTGEYLGSWLAYVSTGGSIRPTTAKAYDVAIRVHIVPRLGRVPLRLLSRTLIKEMYEALHLRGRARKPAGGLSLTAIHNIHLTLHRALEEALDDGLIASNPSNRLTASGTRSRPSAAGRRRSYAPSLLRLRMSPTIRSGGWRRARACAVARCLAFAGATLTSCTAPFRFNGSLCGMATRWGLDIPGQPLGVAPFAWTQSRWTFSLRTDSAELPSRRPQRLPQTLCSVRRMAGRATPTS